jgi:nucleotide-binding universal stress UspA family protein
LLASTPPGIGRIIGSAPLPAEDAVLFKKILIAVDSEPIAAHAAEIGAELARLASAELAYINVIDPAQVNAADTGIPV